MGVSSKGGSTSPQIVPQVACRQAGDRLETEETHRRPMRAARGCAGPRTSLKMIAGREVTNGCHAPRTYSRPQPDLGHSAPGRPSETMLDATATPTPTPAGAAPLVAFPHLC